MILDSKIPGGSIEEKWTKHKFELKLVNPANKRKFTVIVVGTGLAGASAAASLAELGYNVKSFCIQDSPRRAHSIAAQGGINAAKNYKNDGDSVYRLFYAIPELLFLPSLMGRRKVTMSCVSHLHLQGTCQERTYFRSMMLRRVCVCNLHAILSRLRSSRPVRTSVVAMVVKSMRTYRRQHL